MPTPPPSRSPDIREVLSSRIAILDGAMGTMVHALALDERGFRGDRFADHGRDLKNCIDVLTLTQGDAIRVSTLNGPAIANKGMALFPRRIHGAYVMLSRQDGENVHVMESDMLHFWHTRRLVCRPTQPWEFVQIGNCGSPIETPVGWLVLTHGVGPMRKYSIGAVLLDLDDPALVVGRLREPLLTPDENERVGYVPNVVYSCGSAVHDGRLVIPYSMSDYATSFATVPLADVLAALTAG